jgi:xylulokinase
VLVGIDVGTSAVKVLALEAGGGVLTHREAPTPAIDRGDGRSEHDPSELWAAVAGLCSEVCAELGPAERPVGVAVSSMGEAGAPVGADGSVLRPVIGWRDSRTSELPAWWERRIGADALFDIAGVALDPSFGLNKLMWLRDHEPEVFRRTRWWLSVADLVTLWLSGETATDYSLASRTMALDQRARDFSGTLLAAAGVDRRLFPPVAVSGTRIGEVSAAAAAVTGLPEGSAVVLGGHDRLCGAFAARAGTGDAVDSVGTAEALVIPTAHYSGGSAAARAHIPCYCDVVPDRWVYAARVGPAGELVEWAREQLFAAPGKVATYEELAAEQQMPYEFSGVVCLPTFGRSATPFWNPLAARGAFAGLAPHHNRGHLAQALLEGPGFSLRANLDALAGFLEAPVPAVRIEGGLTRSEGWLQLRADVLGVPIQAVALPHATAVGAALLAGVGAGVFADHAAAAAASPVELRQWSPDPRRAAGYTRAYENAYMPLAKALEPIHARLEAFRPPDTVQS